MSMAYVKIMKDLREEHDLTQQQVADILGTSNAHLLDETLYTATTRRLHKGRTTLVLRKHEDASEITLTATAEGLPTVTLTIDR